MLGQFPNISKRGVASLRDSAADEELVATTRSGDELAFESLFKRHRRRIFALTFRYTGVREDAEDIVQQTFQNAFVHLHEFEGKSSFSAPDQVAETLTAATGHKFTADVRDAESFAKEVGGPGSAYESAYAKGGPNFSARSNTEEWRTLEV